MTLFEFTTSLKAIGLREIVFTAREVESFPGVLKLKATAWQLSNVLSYEYNVPETEWMFARVDVLGEFLQRAHTAFCASEDERRVALKAKGGG